MTLSFVFFVLSRLPMPKEVLVLLESFVVPYGTLLSAIIIVLMDRWCYSLSEFITHPRLLLGIAALTIIYKGEKSHGKA